MSSKMEYVTTCPHCGGKSSITLDTEKVERWKAGELIQRVFPEMSVDTREILMTGIHPKCWQEIFGDDDGA